MFDIGAEFADTPNTPDLLNPRPSSWPLDGDSDDPSSCLDEETSDSDSELPWVRVSAPSFEI